VEWVVRGRAGRRRLGGVALVLVVLLAGGVATAGAALAVRRGQQQLAVQAMDHYITDLTGVITDEVSHYEDALADLAAAIATQPALTADAFAAMTVRFDRARLPGASGVTFSVPAYDPQVAATQALWRARGATGLTLYRTGTDIQHKYVIFARSFGGQPQTRGRDLSNTPQSDEVLNRAASTGGFAVSSPHVLLRDRMLPLAEQQISFSMAVPVVDRRERLRGWVTMAVRGGDFLREALTTHVGDAIRLTLSDPASDPAQTIVSAGGGRLTADPALFRDRTISVGRHIWHLGLRPTTTLLSVADRRMTALTMGAGATFTLLLMALVGVLAGARNRAMDQVDRATAALRLDIERRQAVEQELQELAFHDPLTGLANRILFYDRVGHALQTHARDGHRFAVFFLDLDGFKQVNDRLGHSAGDAVLREVAERLRGCLRDSDTVARFGGDEFAVIVERLADVADVHVTAQRIVRAIGRPIPVGGTTATVTASVGIALNRPGDTADDILREADVAMYAAKATGKCRHVLAGADLA
jgi:diguanylate cyclase (GGDEF)-like protein